MTEKEMKQLRDGLAGRLARQEFRQAFSDLGYMMQQNGFGEAYDDLRRDETTYRCLVEYALNGSPDQHRADVLADLARRLLGLADRTYRKWAMGVSTEWYYSRLRRVSAQLSGPVITNLLQAVPGRRDEEMCRFFDYLTLSPVWTQAEENRIRTHVWPCLTAMEQAQAVSALLLGLLHLFDQRKLLFLCDLCESEQPESQARAMVGLLLVLARYEDRLRWYAPVTSRVGLLLDDADRHRLAVAIYTFFLRSKSVEELNRRMTDEFLPEMNRLGSTLQQKLEDQKPEDADWQELFDDGGMSELMQEFSEMQLDGEDVYLSTFSQLKNFPFFQEPAHWFLPFDSHHPALDGLAQLDAQPSGLNLAKVVTGSEFMCSSDKYSFCLNLLNVPEEYRRQMAVGLGADSEAFAEARRMESNGRPLSAADMANLYLQDLYRFFHCTPFHKRLENPFAQSFDWFLTPWLGPWLLTSDQDRERVALVCFKKHQYAMAAEFLESLETPLADQASFWRQKAYCYQRLQQFDQALKDYAKADLIAGDNVWTLKRMAACHRQLGHTAEALACYRRAAALEPENVSFCLNLGHCLTDLKRYDEALNAYYKADFLSGGGPRCWRPIAWCLMQSGRADQAAGYYDRLLAAEPILDDFLNAGHVAWLQGQPRRAVELYVKGMRQTLSGADDFLPRWEKDLPMLHSLGLPDGDDGLMRDGLLYQLENNPL